MKIFHIICVRIAGIKDFVSLNTKPNAIPNIKPKKRYEGWVKLNKTEEINKEMR